MTLDELDKALKLRITLPTNTIVDLTKGCHIYESVNDFICAVNDVDLSSLILTRQLLERDMEKCLNVEKKQLLIQIIQYLKYKES